MRDISETLNQIVECLLPSNPYKIVLFGSYAKGNTHKDSDIDILVILDNENVAKTREERMQTKLAVRKMLWDVNQEFALDVLVYSRAEWRMVRYEVENPFLIEVEQTGKTIYEKNYRSVA